MADDHKPESWHLSKNVPIALILALFVQFGGAVWFFAQMDGRITVNERDITAMRATVAVIKQTSRDQAVAMGRIEESLSGMKRLLERIEGRLAAPGR